MKIRGNYILFFSIEIITAVLLFTLCWFFGDMGLWALSLFFVGMAITMSPKVDEREMQLMYKAGSLESIAMGAVMALLYFSLPQLNWFHTLLSTALLSRGAFGIFVFLKE
ncbi:MAG: hypothetical protein D8M58_16450 [Calditrichaeota bacterium]|nr:MAG: hypothetical protein DWQ03_08180 [Calditrichota bacterium]MBL1206997.1 hypothetical protein [Calditrichota bacterium]NOG46824.1 hypothetical protein [Calditrichota bacterium]